MRELRLFVKALPSKLLTPGNPHENLPVPQILPNVDLKEIRTLIDLMKKNGLAVFKMEREGFKITLKTAGAEGPTQIITSGVAPAPMAVAATAPAAPAAAAPATGAASQYSLNQQANLGRDAATTNEKVASGWAAVTWATCAPLRLTVARARLAGW